MRAAALLLIAAAAVAVGTATRAEERPRLRVLAAGGVRTPDDVAALADAGAEAAIVGRALLGEAGGSG